MWCEIDRLCNVCLDIFYCSLFKYNWVHRPVDIKVVMWGIIIMNCVKYGYLKVKLQI